ncbi:MAG: GGDEF domain-containing protein [Gordonia sp. (in: high G+C Gram-positive bacteria)]|uniref:GGDEF domain-containing protein n=1 Tax=Gordonia sp. (in: high G+C Gram-positive bacteria) TaxID=84139 RepID=UPI003BB73B7D
MEFFDIRTMMLFCAATHLIFGLLLWGYRSRGGTASALATWSVANLVAATAWLLMALRGQVPVIMSVAVANMLLIAGWTLLLVGMRQFAGRPAQPWRFAVLPVMVFVLFTVVPAVRDNLGARVLVVNICLMVVLVTLVFEAIADQRDEPLRTRIVVVAAVSVAVVSNIVRAVHGYALAPGAGFLQSGPVQEAGIFVQGVALLGWSIGLLLMHQERLENQLRESVQRDPLTGLLNRRGFAEREARRTSAGPACDAALLLDLDEFKRINDTYGHDRGDALLRQCADEVRGWARPGDLAARYGGDEFCVLISVENVEAAVARAEVLRRRIRTATLPGPDGVAATVSIGVAVAEGVGTTPIGELIATADEALYRAKREGRDRVVVGADSTGADANRVG